MRRASAHKYHMWIVQRMLCTHSYTLTHTRRAGARAILAVEYALKQPQSAKRAITRHSGKIIASASDSACAFSFALFQLRFRLGVAISIDFHFHFWLFCCVASSCSCFRSVKFLFVFALPSVATCRATRSFLICSTAAALFIGQFVASATCRKINQEEESPAWWCWCTNSLIWHNMQISC